MSAMSCHPDGDKQRGNNPGREIFKVFASPSESEMSWSREAYRLAAADVSFPSRGEIEDLNPVSRLANKIRLVRTASGASNPESDIFVMATREVLEAHGVE